MRMWMAGGGVAPRLLLGLLVAGGLFLALDGDLFWDEPGYLYVGAYVDGPDLLAGTFQPSVIPYFYFPKILHILTIKGLVSMLGPGLPTLAVLAAGYTLLLLASLVLTWVVLRRLLPDSRSVGPAVALTALTPVFLYMSFKTLPEAPALLLATLALYALVRSLGPRPIAWSALAVATLAAMALFRANLGLFLASFVASAMLIPMPGLPRIALLKRVVPIATLAVAMTLAVLTMLGIGFDDFLAGHVLFEKQEPLVFRLVSAACELGLFWLLVPLMLLVRQRLRAGFFLLWFLLGTLPLLILFSHIEPRYLIQNLTPFAGLVAMVLDELRQRWAAGSSVRGRLRPATLSVATAAVVMLLGAHWVALRFMPAEVNVWRMQALLASIDEHVVDADYAILTAWTTTDFYYLRFAYPDRPVFNVSNEPVSIMDLYEPREAMEDRYFQHRLLRSTDGLARLPGLLVYVGYDESFMVANARAALRRVPGVDAERLIPKQRFIDHLTTSWMWDQPRVTYDPLTRSGHYRAFVARVEPSADDPGVVRTAEGDEDD